MDSYDNDILLLILDDDLFWREDNVQSVFQPEYAPGTASHSGQRQMFRRNPAVSGGTDGHAEDNPATIVRCVHGKDSLIVLSEKLSKSTNALKTADFILPFKQGVRGSNPRWSTNKKASETQVLQGFPGLFLFFWRRAI